MMQTGREIHWYADLFPLNILLKHNIGGGGGEGDSNCLMRKVSNI